MSWHEDICEIRVPRLDSHCVHVWQISTAKVSADLEGFGGALAPDECDRASRFHFERDRRSFFACRASLRRLLAGYAHTDAASIRFSYGPSGKPALDYPCLPELRFNVSHSGDLALLAFALGRDVGVDVEVMRELDFVALAQTSFSKGECAAVLACPPEGRGPLFYRYWTCKEACIKADGRGLSVPLDGFSMVPVPRKRLWLEAALVVPGTLRAGMHVCVLNAESGHAAAVAAEGSDWVVQPIDLSSASNTSMPTSLAARSK